MTAQASKIQNIHKKQCIVFFDKSLTVISTHATPISNSAFLMLHS